MNCHDHLSSLPAVQQAERDLERQFRHAQLVSGAACVCGLLMAGLFGTMPAVIAGGCIVLATATLYAGERAYFRAERAALAVRREELERRAAKAR